MKYTEQEAKNCIIQVDVEAMQNNTGKVYVHTEVDVVDEWGNPQTLYCDVPQGYAATLEQCKTQAIIDLQKTEIPATPDIINKKNIGGKGETLGS